MIDAQVYNEAAVKEELERKKKNFRLVIAIIIVAFILAALIIGLVIYFSIAGALAPFDGVSNPSYVEGDFVEVVFKAGFPAIYVEAFDNAAKRWSKVLAGTTILGEDISDGTRFRDFCFGLQTSTEIPSASGNLDHSFILAEVIDIDGPNGILGQAGPCGTVGITDGTPDAITANTSFLPNVGIMSFDLADMAVLDEEGILEDTILHEMAHVLGIGTFWNEAFTVDGVIVSVQEFLQNPVYTFNQFGELDSVQRTTDPTYSGELAVAEYNTLGGVGDIPVESGCCDPNGQDFFQDISTGGGIGSIDSHWSEEEFGTELMTPFIDAGTNPMSRMTIASLQDLGFTVDLSEADSYSIPSRRALRGRKLSSGVRLSGDAKKFPAEKLPEILERFRNNYRKSHPKL